MTKRPVHTDWTGLALFLFAILGLVLISFFAKVPA